MQNAFYQQTEFSSKIVQVNRHEKDELCCIGSCKTILLLNYFTMKPQNNFAHILSMYAQTIIESTIINYCGWNVTVKVKHHEKFN